MAIYNDKEKLYLETDASGVSLEVSLLLSRDRLQFLSNEAPNILALWQIAFASKSLKAQKPTIAI